MLLIKDLKVVTAHACFFPAFHILTRMYNPFFEAVASFITQISTGIWLKSFVIVPLGPVTVILRAAILTVTKKLKNIVSIELLNELTSYWREIDSLTYHQSLGF